MCSLNVAEPRSLDFDSVVTLLRSITDLAADMLALSVAISPDEQNGRVFGLRLNVAGDGSLVLKNQYMQNPRLGIS